MTAVLIFEAIDTASAILNAIWAWIAVLAAVATVVLFTLVLTGASVWRAIRRRHTPATAPQSVPCGSRDAEHAPSPARARTAPSWAHTEHDHQEAA